MEPPTHPHHNKLTTQPSNASKEERNKNNTPQRHEIKTDRQSKTEHTQDAGPRVDRKADDRTPNSRIKNQGLAENNNNRKKTKQTTKQHVPATHVSYQNTNHSQQTTQRKEARPRREKGERVDQPKVRKRFQPPPSSRLAILPIREGVGRDGLSARGG